MVLAEDLKKAVLQSAFQGELTKQLLTDSSVIQTLKNIREDKLERIKMGEIKKDKRLFFDDIIEPPYDIPDTWVWTTLGNILYKLTDGTHKTPKYTTSGIKFVSVKDMSSGKLSLENTKYISEEEHKELFTRCNPKKGDMLLSKVGTTGVPAIIDTDEEFSLFVSVALLKFNHDYVYQDFLYLLLQSPIVQQQAIENTKGVGNKNWVLDKIANTIIPIPPVEEQKRIVERLLILMKEIDEYEVMEKQLEEIKKQFPENMRKAVLQYALQGKLTKQISSDSDVDELIEQIKKEKEALVIKKKARKDAAFAKIEESEKEFDIPENWRWVRLGEIGIYKKGPFGSALTKSIFVPKSETAIKVYEQKNAIQKDATLGDYYISKEYYDEKMQGFTIESGDIIVSCAGTIGETYVMPENIEVGIINQALMRMNIAESINIKYFLFYFDHVLKKNAKKSSNGSAIKNIPPFEIFKNMLIPIPPIEEQQRIIDKLEQILPLIEDLKE